MGGRPNQRVRVRLEGGVSIRAVLEFSLRLGKVGRNRRGS